MKLPPPEVCQCMIALHANIGQSNGADYVDTLLKLLSENGLSWSDWPEIFALHGSTSCQSKRIRRWVRGVHELMGRASTLGERRKARNGLIKRLAEESLEWTIDLPGLLAAEWFDNNNLASRLNAVSSSACGVNLFDLVSVTIDDHIVLSSAQCIVIALWALNSYVYDNFIFAPQIGILVPASGHGKSTLRKVLEATVHNPWHSHHASSAVIYRLLERSPRTTLMFDEAENQNLTQDAKLRAIIDAAYEHDGNIDLVDKDGTPIKFHVFAPVLWAMRGSICDVPMSMVSRAFIVEMKRGTPRKRLERFYFNDPDFTVIRAQCESWAASVQLDLDPEIPEELRRDPRLADNIRPLLAIADNLDRGSEARAALSEVCAHVPNSDIALLALEGAKETFASRAEHLFVLGGFDRISKKSLVAGLIELNPFWGSWRGRNDKGQPHELTAAELSGLLRNFGIFTKTVWPLSRSSNTKSVPGYYLSQFEKAWAEYCEEADTSAHASTIIRLPRLK